MARADMDGGDRRGARGRDGRGRLSSIDTLPEECDEDIAWANAELRERKTPQNEILREFNARLADKGIKGVTKSAFSRYSIRFAQEVRKMEASRQITDVILSRIEPGERSDGMIAATELLKYRILEMVRAEEEPDPKLLGGATLALQRLSSLTAREAEAQRRDRKDQRDQADRDAQAEREAQARVNAEAADAATDIAREAGLSADRIAAIRKGVLGLAS
jgi:hypothetical protein